MCADFVYRGFAEDGFCFCIVDKSFTIINAKITYKYPPTHMEDVVFASPVREALPRHKNLIWYHEGCRPSLKFAVKA